MSTDWVTKAESWRRVAEVDPGYQRTTARVKHEAQLEGRRSPTEPQGWRNEAQPTGRKSMAIVE